MRKRAAAVYAFFYAREEEKRWRPLTNKQNSSRFRAAAIDVPLSLSACERENRVRSMGKRMAIYVAVT